MKQFKFFVGVDVSKIQLDFAIMKDDELIFHNKVNNQTSEIIAFVNGLKEISGFRISNCVFGMEQSGIYCNHLIKALYKLKASYVKGSSLHIRSSLGNIRGKTDKIDSIRIAKFLFKTRDDLSFSKPKRQIIEELSSLVTLRSRLVTTRKALKTPLKEDSFFILGNLSAQNNSLCSRTIEALMSDIILIEERIKNLWSLDERLRRLMEIITSVPCIGEITALHMIICTNEFENIKSPKKFACYAGVAPFPHQSGTSVLKRSRVSNLANKKMKTLLHTCAVLSKMHMPEMSEYFIRKTQIEGKNKMLVLNSIRSKLILRVFTCVNQNRPYQKLIASQEVNISTSHN